MSFDSMIDKMNDFTGGVEESVNVPITGQTTQSKAAVLDNSQLALRAQELEQRLARQKKAKERQQQIEQLVARSEYALGEAEARHQQTDSLHQTLLQLKQKIDITIKEKQEQLDADREVLESYSSSMSELQQSKREADQILNRVVQLTGESQDVTDQMSVMLAKGQESQQQNQKLNLQLQHGLKESGQQKSQLLELIEQCNVTQDRSQHELDSNRLISEQLLERARTTCHQVEQGRLDAEQLIGELNHNKSKAQELISLMSDLGKTGAEDHQRNRSLNNQLEQSLKVSEENRALLMDLQADCRNTKQQAADALQDSQSQHEESAHFLHELRSSLQTVEESRHQADNLLDDMRSASENLEKKLSSIDTIINEGTDSCRESKRLNQESAAVIEQSKQYTQKLADELESSLKLNEKYQDRLQRAENNYRNTSVLHKKYKDLYEQSLAALEAKTALLEDGKTALNAAQSSNAEFTQTVKQFHICTDQAQKLVLESQQTINKLLSEKRPTEPDSVPLVAEVAKVAADNYRSEIQQPKIEKPVIEKPIFEKTKIEKSVNEKSTSTLLDKFGLAYFADDDYQPLSSDASLIASRQSIGGNANSKGASSSIRIMMIIGLTLALTFVASVALKASAATPRFAIQTSSGDRLLDSDNLPPTVSVARLTLQRVLEAPYSVPTKVGISQRRQAGPASLPANLPVVSLTGLLNSAFQAGPELLAVSGGELLQLDDKLNDYRTMALIKHNPRLANVFSVNAQSQVRVGDQLRRRQLITNVGSSPDDDDGSLYFEVSYDERPEYTFNYQSNFL